MLPLGRSGEVRCLASDRGLVAAGLYSGRIDLYRHEGGNAVKIKGIHAHEVRQGDFKFKRM